MHKQRREIQIDELKKKLIAFRQTMFMGFTSLKTKFANKFKERLDRLKTANSKESKVYKIVTYGRPSSGKTCLIAALSLPRTPHPEGYTCTWVRDATTIPLPPGDRLSWDSNDPKVARYLGKERLPVAAKELQLGHVPSATAVDIPYRFLFDFTVPNRGSYRVEMVDYSGELVDPDISDGELVKILKQHMAEADAILVLAEATVSDEQNNRILRELHKLEEAFSSIAKSRSQSKSSLYPVGLLYDKWDRFSKMDVYSLAESKLELFQFLQRDPLPPHVNLRNILRAVAGSDEFFMEFPLSAFGKAKIIRQVTNDGREISIEAPASVSPLLSYGLEDPFISVCRQADELEMCRLQGNLKNLAPWKIWQLADLTGWFTTKDAIACANRFPSTRPEHAKLKDLSNNARIGFYKQCAAGLAACFCLFMFFVQSAVLIYDENKFDKYGPVITKEIHQSNLNDVVTSLPLMEEAEQFLGNYSNGAWYRGLSYIRNSGSKAFSDRKALSEKIASIKGLQVKEFNDAVSIGEEYNNLQHSFKLCELAGHLQRVQPQFATKKDELVAKYKVEFGDLVTQQVENNFKVHKNWDAGMRWLNELLSDTRVMAIMSEEVKRPLQRAIESLAEHKKYTLYNEWFANKEIKEKQAAAREVGMGSEVDKYETFFNIYLDTPKNWKLNIKSLFLVDDQWWGIRVGYPTIKISGYINDQFEQVVSGFKSTGDGATATGNEDMVLSNIKPKSEIVLRLELATGNDYPVGKGEYRGKISNLKDPRTIEMHLSGTKNASAIISISADQLETQPDYQSLREPRKYSFDSQK